MLKIKAILCTLATVVAFFLCVWFIDLLSDHNKIAEGISVAFLFIGGGYGIFLILKQIYLLWLFILKCNEDE